MVFRGTIAVLKPLIPNYLIVVLRSDVRNKFLFFSFQLIVKAIHLRPDPALSAQECCLKVSLLPLWFNLDQDTLAFLVGYFSKLGTDESYGTSIKTVAYNYLCKTQGC